MENINGISQIAVVDGCGGTWKNMDLAERGGVEPPIRLPVCRISSAVRSTTLPPLQALNLFTLLGSRSMINEARTLLRRFGEAQLVATLSRERKTMEQSRSRPHSCNSAGIQAQPLKTTRRMTMLHDGAVLCRRATSKSPPTGLGTTRFLSAHVWMRWQGTMRCPAVVADSDSVRLPLSGAR